MKMNENIEMNGTRNEQEINQTQKNRLLVCRSCGDPIDQLTKGEYLCEECFAMIKKERNKKWLQKFDGFYLYEWINNEIKEPLYLGYTTNFVSRKGNHKTGNTAFSKYIRDNGLKFKDHSMEILDLSAYKDSITIDDVLLLEHFNIANAKLSYKILNDKGIEIDFDEEELERIEYLYELIDMQNYIPFNELKEKKIRLSKTDNLKKCDL